MIAKYELPRGQWEELSTFMFQYCHSQDPQQREVRGREGRMSREGIIMK